MTTRPAPALLFQNTCSSGRDEHKPLFFQIKLTPRSPRHPVGAGPARTRGLCYTRREQPRSRAQNNFKKPLQRQNIQLETGREGGRKPVLSGYRINSIISETLGKMMFSKPLVVPTDYYNGPFWMGLKKLH